MELKPEERKDVTPGRYLARFIKAKPHKHAEYGDRIAWVFRIISGEYGRVELVRFTGPSAREGTHCHDMLVAVTGATGKLEMGRSYDLREYEWELYWVTVSCPDRLPGSPQSSRPRLTRAVRVTEPEMREDPTVKAALREEEAEERPQDVPF